MTPTLPSVTIVRRIKAPPTKVYAALALIHEQLPDAGRTPATNAVGMAGLTNCKIF